MTVYARNWEQTLISWATESLRDGTEKCLEPSSSQLLGKAYEHCKYITQHHSRTFYMASSLLPPMKRRAVHALYAVCRITDDIVDQAESEKADSLTTLEDWYQRLSHQRATIYHPVILAWADTRSRFGIPHSYLRQLVDGVAMDVDHRQYETFEELAKYSYGVASTVGLMAMHITGYESERALPYAVKLGVALQLTNILRDVGEDWRNGRSYLPKDELASFNLTDDDLSEGSVSDRWRAFMRYQIERNRSLYAESLPGIRYLHPDGRFAIAAAAELYQAILTDIEANDYDVFTRRARVSSWGKVRRLPGIWRRSALGVS